MRDPRLPSREEMRTLSPLELAKVHCLAEDLNDPQATVDTFTDVNPYYKVPAFGVDLSSTEEILAFYEASLGAFPDLVNVDPRWTEAPDHVFLEVAFEATFTQPWGEFEPTGNRIRVETFAHFPVAPDGMLWAEIVYLDAVDMYHQMGLLPTGDIADLVRAIAHRRARSGAGPSSQSTSEPM